MPAASKMTQQFHNKQNDTARNYNMLTDMALVGLIWKATSCVSSFRNEREQNDVFITKLSRTMPEKEMNFH